MNTEKQKIIHPNYVQKNPSGQKSSLYVGDLAPSVTEDILFNTFNTVGAISSVRVVRNNTTQKSRGYGFVNYHTSEDASNALSTINFTKIEGREIRIMWVEKNSNLRRSGLGNVFVKNLDESIDNKALYDTFSVLGSILSSKVCYDENDKSRGYGFVHFEKESSAQNAIRKVNGMEIANKTVHVMPYIPREERQKVAPTFTNVYIKNFPADIKEEDLRKIFEEMGEVSSFYFPVNSEGISRGFAFANFVSNELAVKAIENLHGTPPLKLYVQKAEKKSTRQRFIRERYQRMRDEIYSQTAGRNIYVKNLPDTMTEEDLKKEFEIIGPVESIKIQKDDRNMSKGFGFVLFVNCEDANKAISQMKGKIFMGKEIFMAHFQRKEVRRSQLQMQANSNQRNMMIQMQGPTLFPPVGNFNMTPQGVLGQAPPSMYFSNGAAPSMTPQNIRYYQTAGGPPGMMRQRFPSHIQQNMGQYYQQNNDITVNSAQVRPNPNPANLAKSRQEISINNKPVTDPLNDQEKKFYGDKLYALIEVVNPPLASKVTGMFLEMGKKTVQMLLNDRVMLDEQIVKAIELLKETAEKGEQ